MQLINCVKPIWLQKFFVRKYLSVLNILTAILKYVVPGIVITPRHTKIIYKSRNDMSTINSISKTFFIISSYYNVCRNQSLFSMNMSVDSYVVIFLYHAINCFQVHNWRQTLLKDMASDQRRSNTILMLYTAQNVSLEISPVRYVLYRVGDDFVTCHKS